MIKSQPNYPAVENYFTKSGFPSFPLWVTSLFVGFLFNFSTIAVQLFLSLSILIFVVEHFKNIKKIIVIPKNIKLLHYIVLKIRFVGISFSLFYSLLVFTIILSGIIFSLLASANVMLQIVIGILSFLTSCLILYSTVSNLNSIVNFLEKSKSYIIYSVLIKTIILLTQSSGNMAKALEFGFRYAVTELDRGDFKKHLEILSIIADESSYIGHLALEVQSRYQLCQLLGIYGRYSMAIEMGIKALDISSTYNDLELKSKVSSALGQVYEDIGIDSYEKARELYEQALEIDSYLENEKAQAQDYNDLGNIWDKLSNSSTAIAMYEKALEIFIKLDDKSGQCGVYTNIGGIYQKESKFRKAISYHRNSLDIAESIGNKSTKTVSYINLGYCYFGTEEFSDSLNFFQNALPISQELRERKQEVKALQGSADCYLALGSPEKAKFYYQQAIPHLEVMGFGLTGNERRSLTKQYLELYLSLVETCIATNDYNSAFFYIEVFRSQFLVEQLLQNDITLPETVPIEIHKQIEATKLLERKTLQAYTDGLSKNLKQELLVALNLDWVEAKKQTNNLYEQVARIEPEFVVKTRVYPISFQEVKSLLSPDTAIVEFFLTKKSLIVVISTTDLEEPQIPEDLRLRGRKLYLESISKAWISDITNKEKKNIEINEIAQDLDSRIDYISELLRFKNLLSYIPEHIQHLVIIPHGYLHLFPIHALWITDQERLIDRFSVSYSSSLQIWKLCQSRRRSHWQFLGIQNPTQDKDLIFAKVEVASISESVYFVQSNVLQGDAANKDSILQLSSQYECFHFSGHAEYVFEHPLDSYLMLSEEFEDNLTLRDIISDMHLPKADLVTLSACCTGVVDAFQMTDEYLGLPTGFLLAGSKAVVSSLWKVNSIATAFLLDEFYRQLEQDSNKAVALQNAQKWLKTASASSLKEQAKRWDLSKLEAKERFRLQVVLDRFEGTPFESPYYWAAFTLTGS